MENGNTHTPGPWEVVKLSGIGGPHSIRMKYSADKTFYGVRQIHREEDARLIAAAPEMFEALERALKAPMIDHSGRKEGVYDIIRAAIAKARLTPPTSALDHEGK